MKTFAITILALVIGSHSAYAYCTDADKQACACPVESANPPACRGVEHVNTYAVEQAAEAEAEQLTTATPLGVETGCYAGNSLGSATCAVVIYFQGLNGDVSGGVACDVTVGIDGWGSTEVTDVTCVILHPPPHDNGGCTGGQCG